MPQFSIVIPTYNRVHVLERAINSILTQTFCDFELIIVDDGSTDATQTVVGKLQDDRVRYIYQTNKGVSAARNSGIAYASGCYVTFLDSDDEVTPTWLEAFAQAFAQDKSIGIVCCAMQVVYNTVSLSHPVEIWRPEDLGPLFAHQQGIFLAGTFALRREILNAIGGYAEPLAHSENTELALRLIPYCHQHSWQIICLQSPLVIYHRNNLTEPYAPQKYENRLNSARYLLTKHALLLSEDPISFARYCGIAGVNAARLHRYNEARDFFQQAIHVEPGNWRHYARFLATFVPKVAHQLWR